MNPIEAFQNLPPWGKIAAGVAAAGVLVLAIITIRNKQSSAAQPSVSPLGNLSSTNGATSVQQLLQGLGYDPTTGAALSTGQQTTVPAASPASGNASQPAAVAPAPSNNAPQPVPSSTARYVTVQPWYPGSQGDTTLGNIAARYDQGNLSKVLQLNPSIKNPDVIYPGQQIRVA